MDSQENKQIYYHACHPRILTQGTNSLYLSYFQRIMKRANPLEKDLMTGKTARKEKGTTSNEVDELS